jgi:hypothetical protein
VDQVQERLKNEPRAAQSLADVSIPDAVTLFSTYAGQAPEMKAWLADAAINRDLNLRLQYLAGMGSNYQNAGGIMREIMQYRVFPQDLFTGSQETLARLQQELR